MSVATAVNTNSLIEIITSGTDRIRNRSLDAMCAGESLSNLLSIADELDGFWRDSDNLYHRVRAMFFLAAIHRYYIPIRLDRTHSGLIPFESHAHLLNRRFTESIDVLLAKQRTGGPSHGISSALSQAYQELAFQTLADQVRRSVRTVRGNQWMFRIGHPDDHPLRVRPELLTQEAGGGYPILMEQTAVRMDFTHSAWSDIFFLGMDFPAGAKVINASINLGVCGRDDQPQPPIQTYFRVIDEPVLRLVSVDLHAHVDVTSIPDVFDFARDYLGLLKAAVIAAGIVPPGMEGCDLPIRDALSQLVGPGRGIELVSRVNDIPKGSRLAVSTNLLGSLIAICMRATNQVTALEGPCAESERRVIAARAILGEWIGGSGGGWQDSGGVWPGIKLIAGQEATNDDPEFGISRGRLLPKHSVFDNEQISPETRQALQDSLVLVHGGMAQNVGPILEMVTEKYLLRAPQEWLARQEAIELLSEVEAALKSGDIKALGAATTRNFFGPLQTIIPWCTNLYTNSLVEQARDRFGEDFWGFWMLGGMAGGGMGFIFDPGLKSTAQAWLQSATGETKERLQCALPFAMDPVVYDFSINDAGTASRLLTAGEAKMPQSYYGLMVPGWLRADSRELTPLVRGELERIGDEIRRGDSNVHRGVIENILPRSEQADSKHRSLDELLAANGFDREMHEQIRADLRAGLIGLSHNRLPPNTAIDDVVPEDIHDLRGGGDPRHAEIGATAIANREVAVMTLAAGVGSRWTEGAGVVKGLHPFCKFAGRHRSFLEVHVAKSRKTGEQHNNFVPHIVTTGYLTHQPIVEFLSDNDNFGYTGGVVLSPGRSVGLRTVPMMRDLQFAWEEMPQQVLDEQKQKMRASLRSALINWARTTGESTDYTDNVPLQCLHPVGHWYEFPNLLRNGTLSKLLTEMPQLKYIMLHNVDTLGANIDPGVLGCHIANQDCLSFEVIERRIDDRGGGLARVNGSPRLLEGLAMPHDEDEFRLSFYNSMTTWIDIDMLLSIFGLSRNEISDQVKVDNAVRKLGLRMPTYITIKDVKKRWGHGQEDIFPVCQFEKLWGDMSALPEVSAGFFVVPSVRGQQLKQQSQLDGWLRDGSADHIESLCSWGD